MGGKRLIWNTGRLPATITATEHLRKGTLMTTDQRLEKMEGELARTRWLNRCLVASVLVSLALWGLTQSLGPETAWAQSGTEEIRANGFIVEDANGKTRARLGFLMDAPALELCDEIGQPVLYPGL